MNKTDPISHCGLFRGAWSRRPKAYSLKGFGTLVVFGLFCALTAAGASERPNIILVMSDDQGFEDVAYNTDNGLGLQTPNIDQMTKEGIIFDRFYTCPNCSPTRASVLTGRHPFRSGVFNPGWAMNPNELTIATVLKTAGYHTAHFGKWHLGSLESDSPYTPDKKGFEYYLSDDKHFDSNPTFKLNGVTKKFEGEGSAIIVDEAVKYIDSIKDKKPFFILVWYGSPHGGYRSYLPEDLELYEHITEQDVEPFGKVELDNLKRCYAEITAMDRSVGTLRKALKDRGLDQNTLVWFNSDNGSGNFSMMDDLMGGKGTSWDGGTRVPAVAVWPGVIQASSRTDTCVTTVDMMPTLLDITGVEVKDRELDGMSVYPLLQGKELVREKPIFISYYGRSQLTKISQGNPHGFVPENPVTGAPSLNLKDSSVVPKSVEGWNAVIDGQWKLHTGNVAGKGRKGDREPELFDIFADPGETKNVAADHPEIVQELSQMTEEWHNSVIKSTQGEDYTVQPQIIFEKK